MKNNYEELFEIRRELHKLMRRVVKSAKLGRQTREPDDDIELDIGEGTLLSCGKYEQVRFFPNDRNKFDYDELELDNDLENLKALKKEIENRFKEFQGKKKKFPLEYNKGKKKFAMDIFGNGLGEILK